MSITIEIDKNQNPFVLNTPTSWCPGCGNFSILDSLNQTLHEMGLKPQEVLLVSGIGQAAKLPHYMNAHGLNTLHGRALPAAMGAHMGNHNLKIIVTSGDGDTYGEGGNHFLHGVRRNLDIVHMVHDNQIYGLTKGQGSPTTAFGQKTRLQTEGMRPDALNPMALAISLDCSFVARSFSGDPKHLKQMIREAIEHKGYALIDILQPCISFNEINTFKWYKERVYYLDGGYDPYNRSQAFEKALEFGDEGIPLGVLYKHDKPTYVERIKHLNEPLVQKKRTPEDVRKLIDQLV